jgi:hypothetical protein
MSWLWFKVKYTLAGFRDGCDRPLLHPTMCSCWYNWDEKRWVTKAERDVRAKISKS